MMTRRARARPLEWVYDIEAEDWDRVTRAVAISARGDVRYFRGSTIQADLAAAQLDGGTWWAHYGGRYDHLLVWKIRAAWPQKVMLTGSGVLKAASGATTWRDTGPWWLSSLDKVGKAVGLRKLDVDRSRIETLSSGELDRYCARDVAIVWQGILAAREYLASNGAPTWASTSGGSAVALLQALDPSTWLAFQQHTPTYETLADLHGRHAVRGGRVEAWSLGRVDDPVWSYDIHSSYPAAYREGPLPVGCVPATGETQLRGHWLDRCQWTWHGTGPAPELGDGSRGVGECEAWCTAETARWLAECGVHVRRLGVGFKPNGMLPSLANRFADVLYAAKENKAEAPSLFAKVWLNSLHGRLGEHPDRWSLVWDGQEYRPLLDTRRIRPHQQPITAAYVLQRARVRLARALRALHAAGHRVHYCDTDSIHTDCPPAAFAALAPVGSERGQWGLEAEAAGAWYIAPKVYRLQAADGSVLKAASKGLPRGLPESAFEAALRGGATVERDGLESFRQSAAAGEFGRKSRQTRTLRPCHTGKVPDPKRPGLLIYG